MYNMRYIHEPDISKTICGGHYVHFGLNNVPGSAYRNHEQCDAVKLQIHVDEVSLFESSRAQLWPILGRLASPETDMLILDVFSGETKPGNVSEYFQDLINEMLRLQLHGYCHASSGNRCVIQFDCLIADALSRAFIRQVIQNSGAYMGGGVTLTHNDCARESDDIFRSRP
ncbi:uncharacterized protein DEA37_0006042 [Paragonimus westermani]|uniref:Uncharacterized protein n=1 Tax=Paragonimus westermani TaxID=34504 RepID=A0A5J4N8N4_9TREM|nr:uncharacterized protein DEA37_0006042 [Paragonimus westermani]